MTTDYLFNTSNLKLEMSEQKERKKGKTKLKKIEIDEVGDTKQEIIYEYEEEDIPMRKKFLRKLKKLKKKTENIKWITREIAEVMGREFVLMSTLRDTFYYIIFGIFATIICLGPTDSSSYHLFKVLEHQLLVQNGFHDINSASNFWEFLDQAFQKSFYWDYWYYPEFPIKATNKQDRNIFYENKLLGVPRLRQLKVRNDTCTIHRYFTGLFLSCYGRFTRRNEDTRTFGPGSGTAWVYQPSEKCGHANYWGKIDWYHGGGFYQDLTLYRNKTMDLIDDLRKNLWITRGTRAVFLDFTVYNSNTNLFAVLKCAFEFPPTGGVLPSHKAHIVKLLRYTVPYDYFILACEVIVLCFLIYYLLEEIREMIFFRWRYLTFFWSYINSGIIILGFVSFILALYVVMFVHAKLKVIIDNPNQHADLERLADMQKYYVNMSAIMLFLIYLKLFKYLNFNKSMAQLNNTLAKCRKDMMGFAIMFFVIFVAFAMLGYLLFGMEVSDFGSFNLAMFTLLRTILGDFDYTEIEHANRILAPIFFLCFIFLVFFVLLNMFLAIINDSYTDVKTELAIAPEELRMSGYLKRGYYNLLIKLGFGNHVKQTVLQNNEFQMTSNEIKVVLKKIGFTDLEIEMFYARYNIDENAEVQDYDIQALLDALEGKAEPVVPKAEDQRRENTGKPMVEIDDFIKQQEKLDEIEEAVSKATEMMSDLLYKLDHLENVKKIKVKDDSNKNKNN